MDLQAIGPFSMNPTPKSYLDRLVSTTTVVLLVAIGLTWIWHLVEPLLPVVIIGGLLVVLLRFLQRRREW
jgi:predicted PurR-regulated permease PerM